MISASQTVTTTITGNIAATAVAQCTATLFVDNQITGPAAGYTISGDLTGATDAGDCPNTYAFATTVALNSGYVWTQNPDVNDATGTLTGGPAEVTTTITGIVAAQVQNVTATLNVTTAITGPQEFTINTPAPVTGPSPVAYSFSPSISLTAGYSWTSGPTWSPALPITGTVSANTTIPATVTGAITACYANQLYYNSNTTCPTSNLGTYFTDSSSFCSATVIYSAAGNCGSTNYAPSGYYKSFSNQVRFWNGSSFGPCSNC